MTSKAMPGTRRPTKTAYTPHRANQRSADWRPVFPTSTSTGTRPKEREIQKHTAAARTCPKRLNIQPQNTPNASPLAKVMRKDGTGATSACSTIKKQEATGAHGPNERI